MVRLAAAAGLAVLISGGAWTLMGQTPGTETTASTPGDSAGPVPPAEADESSGASASRMSTASLSAGVDAQLDYIRAHWDLTESEQFGFLPENDCVNFTSQSLLARGWATDDEWWHDESGDPWGHPTAWISSTAFMEYLEARPDRATALTDDQRAQVKVGDVVQFDWDDSGDRDHTGVVTSVSTERDGSIEIRYAGHTDATWDRSVDWAITEYHPGGVAYYWSIPE